MKERVPFIVTELGADTDPFMLHIYALAEESRLISERTRAGLAAAKARGVKLGGANEQSEIAARQARERAEQLRLILAELANLSAHKVAEELNRRGIETPKGGKWYAAGSFAFVSGSDVLARSGRPTGRPPITAEMSSASGL